MCQQPFSIAKAELHETEHRNVQANLGDDTSTAGIRYLPPTTFGILSRHASVLEAIPDFFTLLAAERCLSDKPLERSLRARSLQALQALEGLSGFHEFLCAQ